MTAGRCPDCLAESIIAADGTAVLFHVADCPERPWPPACPAPGCTEPMAVRSDGVSVGWCARHRSERLSLPAGTVKPGPRGYGYRVKLSTGAWVASDADGNPRRQPPTRTNLAAILERTSAAPAFRIVHLSPEAIDDVRVITDLVLDSVSITTDPGFPGSSITAAPRRAARAGHLTAAQGRVLDALYCRAQQTEHNIADVAEMIVGTVGKRLAELATGDLAETVGRVGRRRLWALTPAGTIEAAARAAVRTEATS